MATPDTKKLFFDDQDVVNLNINEVYNNFIKEIDSYRSHFNAINGVLETIINQDQIDSVISKTDIGTSTVQESRCSAFFRLMGLPIIDVDTGEFYNPGFDRSLNTNTDLIRQRFKIANNVLKSSLKKTLNFREVRPAQIQGLFVKKDVNTAALALATQYIRVLNFYELGTKDRSILSQSYVIDPRDSFKTIEDESGNKPTVNLKGGLSSVELSQHIIHPLIVDPRIDFTVIPAKNRICVPFLKDKSETLLRANTYLQRPYLEEVITIRCNISNKSDSAGDYVNEIISFINQDSQLNDSSLLDDIQKIGSNGAKFDLLILNRLIKILKASMTKLYNSVKGMENISNEINFYPIPDSRGPEFGSKNRDVTASPSVGDKNIENDIRSSLRKKAIDEVNFNLGLKTASVGNYSFSGVNDIIFGQFKNVSTFYDKQINQLKSQRDHDGRLGSDYLQTIEIITGEISGLGLVDILCIICALWIIPKEDLIGMLDENSFSKLYSFKELRSEEVENRFLANEAIDGNKILKSLEKKVGEMYNLAQKFYDDNQLSLP